MNGVRPQQAIKISEGEALDQDWFVVLAISAWRLICILGMLLIHEPLKFALYAGWGLGTWWALINWSKLVTEMAKWPIFAGPDPYKRDMQLPSWLSMLWPSLTLMTALLLMLVLITFVCRRVQSGLLASGWPLPRKGQVRWKLWNRRNSTQTSPFAFEVDEFLPGERIERVWSPTRNDWLMRRSMQFFRIPLRLLTRNALVLGTPGSGKNYSVLMPLIRSVRFTGSMCLAMDSKTADRPNFAESDFNFKCDMETPNKSNFRFNPWLGTDSLEKVNRLVEVITAEIDDSMTYFKNTIRETLLTLFLVHVEVGKIVTLDRTIPGRDPFIAELLHYIRDPDALQELMEQLPKGHSLGGDLERVVKLKESKHDVLGQLEMALAELVRTTRGLIGTDLEDDPSGLERPSYTVEDLLRPNTRVLFRLPVGALPQAAPYMGKLILTQFSQAIESLRVSKDFLKLAIVDEAQHFITASIIAKTAQCRDTNSGFVFSMQTLSQFGSLKEKALGNIQNLFIMRLSAKEDGEYVSALLGQTTVEQTAYSYATSKGHSTSQGTGTSASPREGGDGLFGSGAHSQHWGNASSHSRSEGTNISYTTQPLFSASELMDLAPHCGVVVCPKTEGIEFGSGELWGSDRRVSGRDVSLVHFNRHPNSPLLQAGQEQEAFYGRLKTAHSRSAVPPNTKSLPSYADQQYRKKVIGQLEFAVKRLHAIENLYRKQIESQCVQSLLKAARVTIRALDAELLALEHPTYENRRQARTLVTQAQQLRSFVEEFDRTPSCCQKMLRDDDQKQRLEQVEGAKILRKTEEITLGVEARSEDLECEPQPAIPASAEQDKLLPGEF